MKRKSKKLKKITKNGNVYFFSSSWGAEVQANAPLPNLKNKEGGVWSDGRDMQWTSAPLFNSKFKKRSSTQKAEK